MTRRQSDQPLVPPPATYRDPSTSPAPRSTAARIAARALGGCAGRSPSGRSRRRRARAPARTRPGTRAPSPPLCGRWRTCSHGRSRACSSASSPVPSGERSSTMRTLAARCGELVEEQREHLALVVGRHDDDRAGHGGNPIPASSAGVRGADPLAVREPAVTCPSSASGSRALAVDARRRRPGPRRPLRPGASARLGARHGGPRVHRRRHVVGPDLLLGYVDLAHRRQADRGARAAARRQPVSRRPGSALDRPAVARRTWPSTSSGAGRERGRRRRERDRVRRSPSASSRRSLCGAARADRGRRRARSRPRPVPALRRDARAELRLPALRLLLWILLGRSRATLAADAARAPRARRLGQRARLGAPRDRGLRRLPCLAGVGSARGRAWRPAAGDIGLSLLAAGTLL